MSADRITKLVSASVLPGEWDGFAEDYFQTREFLAHTEKFNPCSQRYYVLQGEAGEMLGGAVVYTLALDLLTFLKIKSPMKMNIAGVPCSVSASGMLGKPECAAALIEHIACEERGLTIGLNLKAPIDAGAYASGKTLPTILFDNRYDSFGQYERHLRASYRRRYDHAKRKFALVTEKKTGCSSFTGEMHGLYMQVLGRSKGKLETLSCWFFQNLPGCFSLTSLYERDRLIGWYITVLYKNIFYFFLGGLDYRTNERLATYFNMLFLVLRDGIESRAQVIDLGQTAEIPKTRLGGEIDEKYMFGLHSNKLILRILKTFEGVLEYRYSIPDAHVLKAKS